MTPLRPFWQRGLRVGVPVLFVAAVLAIGVVAAVPKLRNYAWTRLPADWRVSAIAWRAGVVVDHSIRIAMKDGVTLAASLYRPKSARGALPTILVRLPYRRNEFGGGFLNGVRFARMGYAVLVQDLRGSGDSGGELVPWVGAEADGVATLDWITQQPWSTGKVGTYGCSALGETQFALARANHPAHRAMVPSGAGGVAGSAAGRHTYFGLFEGGVFNLESGFGWFAERGAVDPRAPVLRKVDAASILPQLPVSALVARARPHPTAYETFVSRPLADPRWHAAGFLSDADRIRVPQLVINTWGDQTVGDTLALAEHWRRVDPDGAGATQRVVIAPGDHCGYEDVGASARYGELSLANATRPYDDWYARWFAHWLQDRPPSVDDVLPPYTWFMLGENRWYESSSWPPADALSERWYLDGTGRANSRAGDGVLTREAPVHSASDRYRYDPADPVPSRGGPVWSLSEDISSRAGAIDQTEVETRDDVLVYTSAPLAEAMRIAGPISAQLAFSSSAPDTDLVARLVDVAPDGRALNIQEGALRLRYRDGFGTPTPMQPGEIVTARVDMRAIAWLVPKGHRLRLQLTSSSFPRLERNLNTGAWNADETRIVVAENAVHHGPQRPSWVSFHRLP